MARTSLTHGRQNRPRHGDQAEHVRLELSAIAGFVALLERDEVAVSGIVDDDVDTTDLGQGIGDRLLCGRTVL